MTTASRFFSAKIVTELGEVVVVADNNDLYYLGFSQPNQVTQGFIPNLGLKAIDCVIPAKARIAISKAGADIIPGRTKPIDSIEAELEQYFAGSLQKFNTPIKLLGTDFQKQVWQELTKIPFGCTISYAKIAAQIGKPKHYRAVGGAVGANQHCIIIPCHRVIAANGGISGFAWGVERKAKLLELEGRL